MSSQPANGDTYHDSTTVSNSSSSDDEHTYEYEEDDFFDLPRPWDGHFNLVLADVDTHLAFAVRNCIIGMKLEVLAGLSYQFFRKDPEIYGVHFHYTKTCIGRMTRLQFESQFVLEVADDNNTVTVWAHFSERNGEQNPVVPPPRTSLSIRRAVKRERFGQEKENDSGSE